MAADAVALRSILAPRYWPAWLGLGLLRLAILLPFSVQAKLGQRIGRLLLRAARKRAEIARANIRHCFPQLSADQQESLLVRHFESLGIALFETGLCWWGGRRKLDSLIINIDGLEHIAAAQQQGKGVILLSAHFTTLEIGARLLANQCRFAPVYRKMNNQIQEYFAQKGRSKGAEGVAIPHTHMKAIIRHLKNGGAIWFASDQQHQGSHSALINFMGQPAHSAIGTSDIAKLGRAAVIPFFAYREGDGYVLELSPPLDDFPSGDAVADTECYHRIIEHYIHMNPEQYLWVHKRFKGAPYAPY